MSSNTVEASLVDLLSDSCAREVLPSSTASTVTAIMNHFGPRASGAGRARLHAVVIKKAMLMVRQQARNLKLALFASAIPAKFEAVICIRFAEKAEQNGWTGRQNADGTVTVDAAATLLTRTGQPTA